MAIERIRLPAGSDGKPIPAAFRFLCNYGHWHPSHRHAVKCHAREQEKAKARADRIKETKVTK